jgi:hypothetical protein
MNAFSLDNKLISVPLKYGAIGGLLVIILNFVFYFIGKTRLWRSNSLIFPYW